MRNFFKYLMLGFLLSSLNINLTQMSWIDIVRTSSLTFVYNFIVGIPTGLAIMFGMDLYVYLKKNTSNEQYRF